MQSQRKPNNWSLPSSLTSRNWKFPKPKNAIKPVIALANLQSPRCPLCVTKSNDLKIVDADDFVAQRFPPDFERKHNSRNSRRAPCAPGRDLLRCRLRSRRSAGEERQPKPPRRSWRRGPADHKLRLVLAKTQCVVCSNPDQRVCEKLL